METNINQKSDFTLQPGSAGSALRHVEAEREARSTFQRNENTPRSKTLARVSPRRLPRNAQPRVAPSRDLAWPMPRDRRHRCVTPAAGRVSAICYACARARLCSATTARQVRERRECGATRVARPRDAPPISPAMTHGRDSRPAHRPRRRDTKSLPFTETHLVAVSKSRPAEAARSGRRRRGDSRRGAYRESGTD